jgi:RHS repeat-associated protein
MGHPANYSFDAASQLTGIVYQGGALGMANLSYAYDLAGRRIGVSGSLASTQLPAAVSLAVYNANNQLTQWGTTAMTYDANGNTLNDGSNSYVWDARNRLVSADNNAASYAYDPLGRRMGKTFMSANTNYLYDGANPVQELNGTTPTANLLTGGLDERFTRTDATGTYNFLTDALGSTVALTDSTGNSQTQYSYDPYGGQSASGAYSTNSFTYTGRETDGLGIDYYRARYYNPQIGRFLSEDPLGFAGGDTNLYAYVGGDPSDAIDPLGLSSLVYNGSTATITLYSGNNFDGTILAQGVAYNFVASGYSTFPYGIYQAGPWHQYNAGDPDSPYGPYGNLTFNVPGHTGMSVHSGRNNLGGPTYNTHGCIRTTDNFMNTMYNTQFNNFNPVTQIMNVDPFNPPPGTNPTPLFWPPGAGNPPAPTNPWSF